MVIVAKIASASFIFVTPVTIINYLPLCRIKNFIHQTKIG